jgi:uncharacterized protein (DUF433 family)
MSVDLLTRHIELTPGVAGGKARIAGRRITVQNIVVWHERLGQSVDEIAAEHDLSHADIHAALTYYFDHRDLVNAEIERDVELAAAVRRSTPSRVAAKLTATT